MNRLKTLLLWDSSKFIHLAITSCLFILTKSSYIAIILLLIELAYLFKASKNLLIYSFIIFGILAFRINFLNEKKEVSQGQITEIENDRLLIRQDGSYYYLYLDDTSDFGLGMLVKFKGQVLNFDVKNIPGNFDYSTYLKSKNIREQYLVDEIEIIGKRISLSFLSERIKQYISSSYPKKASEYLNLFILGNQKEIESDILIKSRNIGISHLFAISGMHLSLIVAFLSYLLNRFYLDKKTHQFIIGGFLLIYNIITGFSISILRASLLTIFLIFNKRNSFTRTDYLSFIMIGFLIYNPDIIYNIGFKLSFLISFSIIMGNYLWKQDSKLIQLFKITLLANLVSLPIILDLNKNIGIMNLIYNLFFVNLVSFVFLPLSFLTILIKPFTDIYLLVINIFESTLEFTHQANYYFSFTFGLDIFKVLYWSLLLFGLINYHNRFRKIAFICIILLIMGINNYQKLIPFSYVNVLDVNQGDSIHIHQNTCDILIDTGKSDEYDSVINYFRNLNINDIDILVITHFHDDHYGEAFDILNNLNVDTLVVSSYNKLFKDYSQIVLNKNDVISCGELSFININQSNDLNENNNSIVLYGLVGFDNWLFTGDIEKEREEMIIKEYNLSVDVLKVPHHGSITSSSKSFLEALEPQDAIISVGYNTYDHPNKEIIERYFNSSINVFRTDQSGSITYFYTPISKRRIISSFLFKERLKYHF